MPGEGRQNILISLLFHLFENGGRAYSSGFWVSREGGGGREGTGGRGGEEGGGGWQTGPGRSAL